MSRNSAALILDILSDPVARVPGFGANTPFDFDFPVAVKTGTSHHFTDNWAVGVTASFTVAVWVGNFSGRPMQRVSGLTGAGPLLQRAVLLVAQRYDAGRFTTPADAGARAHRVCQLSGHEPGPYCPTVTEWFAGGSSPTKVCDWHATSWVTLPEEYTEWNELHNAEPNWYVAATAPVPTSEPRSAFRIVAPLDSDVYRFQPGVDGRYATIGFRSAGGVSEATWYVDGDAVHGTRWRLEPGRHVIRAVTANRNWDEVVISVEGQPPSAQGTGSTVSSGSSP
jgi:penicillin-binding protein 1C